MALKGTLLWEESGKSVSVSQNTTGYSDGFDTSMNNGFIAVLITSSAGSITVTQQCSVDNDNWYDPVDEDGTAIGAVVSSMTVGTKYIQFSPVMAPFSRFKIVEGNVGATTVTIAKVIYKDVL